VTNTADFVLTYDAIKDPDKCEGNPILGDMDEDNIYYYYIGSELLILGIASLLPDEVRSNYFLIPLTVIKIGCVGHNLSVGCEFDF